MNYAETLGRTIRVSVDGSIERGIEVLPVRVGERILAAPPLAAASQRYAPHGVPRGVDLDITLPHDCANHLPVGA